MHRTTPSRTATSFLALVAVVLPAASALGLGAAPAGASGAPPVVERETLGPGVEHLVLEGDGVHADVAEVAPDAPYDLRVVLAGNRVGDRLERTSAMCARVDCLVGVNGDFTLGTTIPVGGVIQDGALLKSPSPTHHQLLVGRDGRLSAEAAEMTGKLVLSDLRETAVDRVNGERGEDEVVLYTPRYGPTTRTNPHGVEWPLRFVQPPGPLRLGQTHVVALGEPRQGSGDSAIPEDGAVLSAHGEGAETLLRRWASVEDGSAGRTALLRVEAEPSAEQSIGGTPVLLRDGARWFGDDGSQFVRGDHPRTVVGWNDEGRVWLVTVDGRQPGYSRGASLADAADLLLSLGATDALNLDGGGSTTFTVKGEVANRPSDRLVEADAGPRVAQAPGPGDVVLGNVERPRANALVLVPRDARPPQADPMDGDALVLPGIDLPPSTGDPASLPGSNLPGLVAASGRRPLPPAAVAVAAVMLALTAMTLGLARARREGGVS